MPKYVMATDEDFKKLNGHFCYLGKEPYIEIPHIIQGEKITDIDWMFYKNKVIKGIKSTNKNIKSMNSAFFGLKTDTLDLSGFDFSNSNCDDAMYYLEANTIIFPTKGFETILKSNPIESYYPLRCVPANSQTEEICWAAVTDNKKQGQFVKIKSKKILMYLGAECPEYTKFYYDEEK